jgi:hypothetical protein
MTRTEHWQTAMSQNIRFAVRLDEGVVTVLCQDSNQWGRRSQGFRIASAYPAELQNCTSGEKHGKGKRA